MAEPANFDACYRHPKRMTGVKCQRCNRPICPWCMVPADVGFHCPHCVWGWTARLHDIGRRLSGGPRWVRVWRGRVFLALIIVLVALWIYRR